MTVKRGDQLRPDREPDSPGRPGPARVLLRQQGHAHGHVDRVGSDQLLLGGHEVIGQVGVQRAEGRPPVGDVGQPAVGHGDDETDAAGLELDDDGGRGRCHALIQAYPAIGGSVQARPVTRWAFVRTLGASVVPLSRSSCICSGVAV